MKPWRHFRPDASTLFCAALCFTTVAFAQDTTGTANQTTNPPSANPPQAAVPATGQDEYPDIVEINPFGGISTWGTVLIGLGTKLHDGGVAGLRVAYNPASHFGIELWGAWSVANVTFQSSSGLYPAGTPLAGTPLPNYGFGARNYFFGLNPVFNLRARGTKVQPYLTVGVNGIQFTPTGDAKRLARSPAQNSLFFSGNLNDNLQVGLNYGGGVKFHLSDHFGLRLDGRGFWSRNPTYGLPDFPNGGIYIPSKHKINGFQGTVGLVFYAGHGKCPPMPPAPAPPPALPQPTITGGEGTICPGKEVTLHANVPGAAPGRTLAYAWTVNGQSQGGNSPDLTVTPPAGGGTLNVQLTVTDTTPPPPPLERPKKFPERCWVQPPAPPAVQPVTATAALTVTVAAPTVSGVTATPNTLMCSAVPTGDHTAQLTVTAQAGACGGNLTYAWTVSEGSVTNGNTANATFDASSLNFEGGAQGQTKTVTATVTVTDQNGQTAQQSTTITVNCPPQYQRLDDLVFAKNNSRVNNCAKRILIEDTAPKVATGDYDIVLVGHRDTDEEENVPAGRRRRRGQPAQPPTSLDEQRVLNAAAVLTGGHGTCANVDPSRVKIDWVGTDQTSETRPGLCGTSNTNIKERRGQATSAADKNRRVEVYIVPRGQANPPAVKNPRPLPQDVMQRLGCPK